MSNSSRSRRYWEERKDRYPFQVDVPHMSEQDPDPAGIGKLIGIGPFLRCPFNKRSYWGFTSQRDLDTFKRAYGVP